VFANALCTNTYEHLKTQLSSNTSNKNIPDLIKNSLEQGLQQSLKHKGSSTICIGVLTNETNENNQNKDRKL